jgi:hypothetical protein
MYKSEDVGFFTYKDIGNGVYFPFLGGLYKENAKAGIGVTLNLCEIEEAGKRNAKKMLSAYSTNNRGASAIHLQMGYILDEIMCVFVKHN